MPSRSDDVLPFVPPKHRHKLPSGFMPYDVEPVPINDWEDEVGAVPIDRYVRTNLDELATIIRRLSYSEMIDFASGIKHDPAAIHKWAKEHEGR